MFFCVVVKISFKLFVEKNIAGILYQTVKQFGSRLGLTFCGPDHGPNCLQSLKSPLAGISPHVGFVALRPKSTAMVIAGRSVHLTTLFPGQA